MPGHPVLDMMLNSSLSLLAGMESQNNWGVETIYLTNQYK